MRGEACLSVRSYIPVPCDILPLFCSHYDSVYSHIGLFCVFHAFADKPAIALKAPLRCPSSVRPCHNNLVTRYRIPSAAGEGWVCRRLAGYFCLARSGEIAWPSFPSRGPPLRLHPLYLGSVSLMLTCLWHTWGAQKDPTRRSQQVMKLPINRGAEGPELLRFHS